MDNRRGRLLSSDTNATTDDNDTGVLEPTGLSTDDDRLVVSIEAEIQLIHRITFRFQFYVTITMFRIGDPISGSNRIKT